MLKCNHEFEPRKYPRNPSTHHNLDWPALCQFDRTVLSVTIPRGYSSLLETVYDPDYLVTADRSLLCLNGS